MGSDYSSLPMSDTIESLEDKVDTLNTNILDLDDQIGLFKWLYESTTDVLASDDSEEYYVSDGNYTLLKTFVLPERIHGESELNIYFEIKSGHNSRTATLQVRDPDGNVLINESTNNTSYVAFNNDIKLKDVVDNTLKFYLRSTHYNGTYCRNRRIRGNNTKTQYADIEYPDWAGV